MLESEVLMVKEMRAGAGCEERQGPRQNLQWAGDSSVRLQGYSSALVLPPLFSSSSSSSSFSLAVDPQGILCLLAKDTL